MAARKNKTPKKTKKTATQIKARNQILALVLFTVGALFTALSVIEGSDGWWPMVHNVLFGLFGLSAYCIGPVFIYIGVMSSYEKFVDNLPMRAFFTAITIFMISATSQIFMGGMPESVGFLNIVNELYAEGQANDGGGISAFIFGLLLLKLGSPGDAIAAVLLLFLLGMIITNSTLAGMIRAVSVPIEKVADSYQDIISSKPDRSKKAEIDIPFDVAPVEKLTKKTPKREKLEVKAEVPAVLLADEPEKTTEQIDIEDIIKRVEGDRQKGDEVEPNAVEPVEFTEPAEDESKSDDTQENESPPSEEVEFVPEYIIPPVDLLRESATTGSDLSSGEELRQTAQTLVDTLQSFGVQTRIVNISRGPAVTRYELQPSAGVKISKITNLADDIALNLAAAGVRIEAPIPNKAAVGIEIPNKNVSNVTLREVIESTAFAETKSKVSIALGRDVSGNAIIADVTKMPHLLIAGATGSGKSVCINSIIMSILYKAKPDEVKLILIDPKMVELGVYNGLPHLVVPVVNDAKKAAGVLGWAVTEMMQRYQTFAQHNSRDISIYNNFCKKAENEALVPMPHIVIIVDELADLMMAASADVEDHIWRLAQMARAAGMHLIIATQRPSVDVITGVIKANIPSRIAFAVSSQIDSRTILDASGAEKLLGQGDMLFCPVGTSKPIRVQGCYVSDDEIERVVSFIKSSKETSYDQQVIEDIEKHIPVTKGSGGAKASEDGDADDEMLMTAMECVVEAGIASTSLLQRRCKLGYARAARIIDELELRGIVGPFEGSKPRQVLISKERFIEMKLNKDA